MKREQGLTWKEYFAELVRIAIREANTEDIDRVDMGMDAAEDIENEEEYKQAWKDYYAERNAAFKEVFGEDFDYFYIGL